MIRVTRAPEPANFNGLVRDPGLTFLRANPAPTNKQFRRHSYWTRVLPDLRSSYNSVCAYTCMYRVGSDSVDHFMPKVDRPNLAYEWDNYRLASQRVNSHKGNSQDVIDPFVVSNGSFVIDFPSCLVKPAAGLRKAPEAAVIKTIEVLRLNLDDTFVQERCDLMVEFAYGRVTIEFLENRYPFLAEEVRRQELETTAAEIFKLRVA
jgi:hypothetical protein